MDPAQQITLTSEQNSKLYGFLYKRQKDLKADLADLYSPGNGQRVQIRDTSRRIIGYIELDGSITNTRRQPVGSIEALRD